MTMMTTNDLPSFFRLAKNASLLNVYSPVRTRMGAVLVRKHKVLAFETNHLKSHPKWANGEKYFSIHCEVKTVLTAMALGIDVIGSDIYIFRQTKSGDLALAKPCESCFAFLLENKIKTVYYTVTGGYEYFTY